jgi:hypothetical protein
VNGSSPDDFLRRIQRPGGGVNPSAMTAARASVPYFYALRN